MIAALAVITGLVILAALLFGALVSLARHGKGVVVGAEGRSVPARLARPEVVSAPPAPAPSVVVEPVSAQTYSGLSKAQAEELLDWLERNGRANCELSYDAQTGFTVRCP